MINLLKVARYIRDHHKLEEKIIHDFTTNQLLAFKDGVLDGMGDYVKRPSYSREYQICDLWYRYYNLGEKSAYWDASHERIYLRYETPDCNRMYEYGVRISMSGFNNTTYSLLTHSIIKIYLFNECSNNKVIKGMINACNADVYDIVDDWSSNYRNSDLLIESLAQTLSFQHYLNEDEYNLYIHTKVDCKTIEHLYKMMLFDLNFKFNYNHFCHNLVWLKKKSYISWTAYAYLMRKAKIRLKEYLR